MRTLNIGLIVAAGLLFGGAPSFAASATQDSRTKSTFSNVLVTGNLEVDGAQTVDGVINTSAATPYAIKVSSKTAAIPAGTPSSAGLIAFDSTYVMYVSTGTGAGAWVKVGGQ